MSESESESESDNNYFSNTDSEKEEKENLDGLYSEEDEEYYQFNEIVTNHIQNIDINDEINSYAEVNVEKKKIKKRKEKKVNTKKIIQIQVNEFEVKKDNQKVGKWKSKRMQNIKKKKGCNTKEKKNNRRFHPNLPSPLYLRINNFDNSKNIDLNDKNYPSLK